MSTEINNPHDKIFKQALSEIQVAKEFFKNYLAAKVLAKINLDSLTICKETYIDPKLKEFMSDILYQVDLVDNKNPGYFYLTAEHQSSRDPLIAFRIWKYAFLAIDQHLKANKKYKNFSRKKIPLVVPIIFYNGAPTTYKHTTDLFKLFEDEHLARELFLQPIELINVHKISDEIIRKHTFSGLLEFLQKYIYKQNIIPFIDNKIFVELLDNLQKHGLYELSKNMILYILRAGNINNFDELADQLKKIGVDTMSIAEELINKGVQQGMQQGKISLFMQLLQFKFKNIPQNYQKKIDAANSPDIFKWSTRAMSSDALEEIFQD